MKEVEKKKVSNTNQSKLHRRSERGNNNLNQENSGKKLNGRKSEPRASRPRQNPSAIVGDTNTGTGSSEVHGNTVMHYMGDVNRSGEGSRGLKPDPMTIKQSNSEVLDDHSSDLEKESKQGIEEESDSETFRDSVSSQGDSVIAEDEKVDRGSRNSEAGKTSSFQSRLHGSRVKSDGTRSRPNVVESSPKASPRYSRGQLRDPNAKSSPKNSKIVKFPPKPLSESSEGVDDKPLEEVKEIDVLEEISSGGQSAVSDVETIGAEDDGAQEAKVHLARKVDEMEKRIQNLEEELRAVSALEISLYSVVPQHGSSSHKMHTPARQLSRLYVLASKYWTPEKQAIIAKNIVSGLVLIGKSCGTDISR